MWRGESGKWRSLSPSSSKLPVPADQNGFRSVHRKPCHRSGYPQGVPKSVIHSQLYGRDKELEILARSLTRPGLSLVSGPPGIGKTVLAREASSRRGKKTIQGGALPTLGHLAGLPLARAIRAPIPTEDLTLAVALVRTSVGDGTLILDDAQWADPWSLSIVAQIAGACRVVVTLRSSVDNQTQRQLERVSSRSIVLGPVTESDAHALLNDVNPSLSQVEKTNVIRSSGGVPLALIHLAKDPTGQGLRPAVARTVAELSQSSRTSLAACGLLGRPVEAAILGAGVRELVAAGLLRIEEGVAEATSRMVAELSASMLDESQRSELHLALAAMLPPDEAAYHFAAAGKTDEAVRAAQLAANQAATIGEKNRLLMLGASLAGSGCPEDVTLDAASAALDLADYRAARRFLGNLPSPAHEGCTRRALLEAQLAVIDSEWESAGEWLERGKQGLDSAESEVRHQFPRDLVAFLGGHGPPTSPCRIGSLRPPHKGRPNRVDAGRYCSPGGRLR